MSLFCIIFSKNSVFHTGLKRELKTYLFEKLVFNFLLTGHLKSVVFCPPVMRKAQSFIVVPVLVDLHRFLDDVYGDVAALTKKHKSCVKQANKQFSNLGNICYLHEKRL